MVRTLLTAKDMYLVLRDLHEQADIMPCPHPVCTDQNCAIIRAERILRRYEHECRPVAEREPNL